MGAYDNMRRPTINDQYLAQTMAMLGQKPPMPPPQQMPQSQQMASNGPIPDMFAGLSPSAYLGLTPGDVANEGTGQGPMKPPQMPPPSKIEVGGSFGMPQAPQSLESQTEAQYQSLMDARNKGISDYDAKMKALSAKKDGIENLDLSGLAALADAWGGGSNFAGVYKRPENAKDRAAQIAQLEELKKKAQGELGDDQLAYLKSKMDERKQDAYMKLMYEKAKDTAGSKDDGLETRLRAQWDNEGITKNTKEVAMGLSKIQEGYRSKDPAAYMTMIYGLMKMQDPGSSVKEGEFQTGQGIGGWPEQWKAAYQKATGDMSGPITQLQRDSILKQAQGLYRAQMANQQQVDKVYTELAKRKGINHENVVLTNMFNANNPKKQQEGPVDPLEPGNVWLRNPKTGEFAQAPSALAQQATQSGKYEIYRQ